MSNQELEVSTMFIIKQVVVRAKFSRKYIKLRTLAVPNWYSARDYRGKRATNTGKADSLHFFYVLMPKYNYRIQTVCAALLLNLALTFRSVNLLTIQTSG